MRREVLRHARLAMPREIGGRCATDELGDSDLPRDEVLAADGADPHGRVETLVDEIDDAVGKLDIEAHLRIARHELGDCRGDMAGAERDAAREAQRAARREGAFACGFLRFFEICEQLDGRSR